MKNIMYKRAMKVKEERESFLKAPENRDLLFKALMNFGKKY